jgi:hypothetical protein
MKLRVTLKVGTTKNYYFTDRSIDLFSIYSKIITQQSTNPHKGSMAWGGDYERDHISLNI